MHTSVQKIYFGVNKNFMVHETHVRLKEIYLETYTGHSEKISKLILDIPEFLMKIKAKKDLRHILGSFKIYSWFLGKF